MSDAIEVLGWTLLHFVWQGAVVGVLAAMLLVALRRRSANARYLTAVTALGLMLLLPLGTFAWIDQTPPTGEVSPIEISIVEFPRTREDETLALDEPPINAERISIDSDSPPANAVSLAPVSDTGLTLLDDSSEMRSAFQVESFLKPFVPWAAGVWLIGVGVLSLRLFASWLSVQRLRRRATQPAGENWQAMLGRIAERLRVTRPVKLVESALVEVPTVIGWLTPMILFPAAAMTGLTSKQLEALLAHELAHVRRHDYLVNLLQTVVETLLFYHPAVWWLSHRIRLEREHCCDDLAVQACGDRVVYAKALVALEELRGPKLGLAMSSRGGSLLARVARLLGQAEQQRQPVSWIAGLLSLVLLTTVGAFGAGLLTLPEKPDESLAQDLSADEPVVTDKSARPIDSDNDWPQWGRSSHRNNVAKGRLPLEWDLEKGRNIVWKAKLGTSTYSSPIISGGKVFIGTNNGAALNPAHPQGKDMSCLVCFEQSTGKFLWQYASEKTPTGRVHDWPGIGLCSTACVAGDRVWVVTNRCEVICLDADGFRDGENDGPFREEPAQTEIDADVIWKFDMFRKLGVRPLHQSVSSITQVDGVLLLNTSNGPDETLVKIPAPHAPNFLALDAKTGRVIWSDNSAGESIVVGGSWRMCSNSCSGASPSVATLGGVTQAIFTGKEGWVYSYDFTDLKLGKTTLLWQFDCNPKTAKYVLGRSSRRLTLLASPVIADDRVYVATGQNPEMGEGEGDLWCIDPTKRGDLSTELVFNKSFEKGEKPIPHKPLCACETDKGDFVRPNPNAGAIWHYSAADRNGNGKIEFEETFHCTLGNPVIHNGLLFVSDYSGFLHCLDSRTGEVQWTHDLISASWCTCTIADGHVIIGDEDGDLEIFKVARTKQPVHGLERRNFKSSIYSTPVVVSGMLVVATKDTLVAIRDPKQGEEATLGAVRQGQFTGRVRLKPEKPLPDLEKVEVPAGKLLDESLVFSKDGGLANVFVYLRKPTFPIEPPAEAELTKPFVLMVDSGKLWPHAALVGVGRPMVLENGAAETMNIHTHPIRNNPVNVSVPAQGRIKAPAFDRSESIPLQVKNDIRPWMLAHVLTVDHPFAAITDNDGRFAINGLPPGEHEFRVWHERVGWLEKSLVITIKPGEDARSELEYVPDRLKLTEADVLAWGKRLFDAKSNPQPGVPRPAVPPPKEVKPPEISNLKSQVSDPKPDAVKLAIERGIAFLTSQQQDGGTWQGTPADGVTALCVAALLQARVKADDPVMQKALAHLRKVEPTFSYTVALQTMVFCSASPKDDAELIRRNVAWLEKAQVSEGRNRGAWSYKENAANFGDGSCSRFAVMGLHAAKRAGFEVQAETWRNVSDYWLTSQKDQGPWGYTPQTTPTPTMTLAGIACLATANLYLPQDERTKTRDAAMRKPAEYLEKSIPDLTKAGFAFYALQSLERAGHISGIKEFGKLDWQADLTKQLLEAQQPNGSWKGSTPTESELIATSFALLALTGQPEPKQNARADRGIPAPASEPTASVTDAESRQAVEAIERWREATSRLASYEAELNRWEYDYVFNVMKRGEGTFRWQGADSWRLELRSPKGKSNPATEQRKHWETGQLTSFDIQAGEPVIWSRQGDMITQEDGRLGEVSPGKRVSFRIPEESPRPKGYWGNFAAQMFAQFTRPLSFLPPTKESQHKIQITRREANELWLVLQPTGDEAASYQHLTIVLDQQTSLPRAARLIDPAGTRETVVTYLSPRIEWKKDREDK